MAGTDVSVAFDKIKAPSHRDIHVDAIVLAFVAWAGSYVYDAQSSCGHGCGGATFK